MSKSRNWVRGLMLAAAVAVASTPATDARADDAAEAAVEDHAPSSDAEREPLPWKVGPAHVDLGHELGLELPERYMYLPAEAASKVLERMGSFHNEGVLGLATSTDEKADWLVVISYDAEGFIKDDETIDAEGLLGDLREGLDAANDEREERGFARLALDGWAEAPRYDHDRHHLVWALVVSDKDGKSVNYNTRILGRHGFASLNLVTDPSTLAQYKPEAEVLLGHTSFGAGARYEDFNASSDKTAEYGLAGLIAAGAGVGAAKLVKLGLLAKFGKLLLVGLAAGKKVIVLAVAAGAAAAKKWLGARKGEAAS
ncbi:MAG TPA: DUF2167 domain-containing protein [Polyangiaceae bacterium]|nr:DUF2167 domain-containing protein [Polyangiaceae bacterium]